MLGVLAAAAEGGGSVWEAGRVLQTVVDVGGNSTGFGPSSNGCICQSVCDTSFDSLIPWCLTSDVGVERLEVLNPCGQYSQRRTAYWDECTVNLTSVDHLAETFDRTGWR